MLAKDFNTYRMRCRICKEVKDRKEFGRMSYRICKTCRANHYKNLAA